MQREGHTFAGEEGQEVRREVPKDPNVVQSQQEEDDIAKERIRSKNNDFTNKILSINANFKRFNKVKNIERTTKNSQSGFFN